MNEKTRHRIESVALVCLASYYVFVLYNVTVQDQQWDFKTYYYAAKAYAGGDNPYSLADLVRLSSGRVHHYFVYPPVTLPLFLPLALFDYHTAAAVFLALKAGALVVLILIWRRLFAQEPYALLVLFVLCAVGYRFAIARDFQAGNVSCLEQVLIWSGLLCFLRKRPVAFSVLIACSALFKITSLLFLLLPLLDRDRRSITAALASATAFFSLNAISFALQPALRDDFVKNMIYLDERGTLNPSAFSVIRELINAPSLWTGWPAAALAGALYLCFVGAMVIGTYYLARGFDFRSHRPVLVMLVLFLYALIVPRFKSYAYILLIVPSLFVVRDALSSFWARAAAMILLCVSVHEFQSPLAALLLFAVYLKHVHRQAAPGARHAAGHGRPAARFRLTGDGPVPSARRRV